MTRSPLFYPLNRGMDAEAGGVADLQTDVMRFIAILALCLVAIFALVQSIPLLPTVETPSEPPATREVPEPQIIERKVPEPTPPVIEKPAPSPVPIEQERPLFITRTVPQPLPKRQAPQRIIEQTIALPKTEESVQPVNEPVTTESEGFTLRFETDLALTRLVARNEVGLYAITPAKSLRMNVNRGSLSFWPASVPNEFHEMDEGTVPEDVLAALRRAGSVKTAEVKWGVTLPRAMRSKLDGFLREHRGGSLIISGNGDLRLEP